MNVVCMNVTQPKGFNNKWIEDQVELERTPEEGIFFTTLADLYRNNRSCAVLICWIRLKGITHNFQPATWTNQKKSPSTLNS